MATSESGLWRAVALVLCVMGALVSLLPFFMLIGLGVHRHAEPVLISTSATLLTFLPPVAVALARMERRSLWLGAALCIWSALLIAVLPLYFPGERRQAVATGLAVAGIGSTDKLPNQIAESLPEEPEVASPEVAEASPLNVEPPPPVTDVPLSDDQMVLSYEGEGRRMTVPVVFTNARREIEVDMMFDTGATYTTLPLSVLGELGIVPGPDDPVIRLHTANGERQAQLVLLDEVWLGDLRLEGVAIATCDDCASDDTVGLLGLNVAGAFNLAIDADRREVVFTRRQTFDRKLDVKPFSELSATFTRFPGGRVEVQVSLEAVSRRDVLEATAAIGCGDTKWEVDIIDVPSGDVRTVRRRLPRHVPCEAYEISLHEADW
ncbi:MAG: retropepsin-like aspartic protease [Myxococcota bacterium]